MTNVTASAIDGIIRVPITRTTAQSIARDCIVDCFAVTLRRAAPVAASHLASEMECGPFNASDWSRWEAEMLSARVRFPQSLSLAVDQIADAVEASGLCANASEVVAWLGEVATDRLIAGAVGASEPQARRHTLIAWLRMLAARAIGIDELAWYRLAGQMDADTRELSDVLADCMRLITEASAGELTYTAEEWARYVTKEALPATA